MSNIKTLSSSPLILPIFLHPLFRDVPCNTEHTQHVNMYVSVSVSGSVSVSVPVSIHIHSLPLPGLFLAILRKTFSAWSVVSIFQTAAEPMSYRCFWHSEPNKPVLFFKLFHFSVLLQYHTGDKHSKCHLPVKFLSLLSILTSSINHITYKYYSHVEKN